MIENAVQDDADPFCMRLRYKIGKKTIGCLQILLIRHTTDKTLCPSIVVLAIRQNLTFILHNLPIMWINMIIICNIILMIRWRHKKRIKINHLNPQTFQIV